MTAPALVLLGYGSGDPRSVEVSHQLRSELLRRRPTLDVHVAYLDHNPPTGVQVARTLVRQGVREAVFVPLVLSDAYRFAGVDQMLAQVRAAQPSLAVTTSRPLGPDPTLLPVLDRRLRDALRSARASELDALVFAAEGSPDVRSTALLARRARQWAHHHKLPYLVAFAAGSAPGAGDAVRTLRAQGRRHIAVGSWFAAPGTAFLRSGELAEEAGALAVSAPLGAEPELADAILARYVVAAMDLVDLGFAEPEPETAPARHLSVVGA